MDSYTIDTAFIYGDFLKVNVSYWWLWRPYFQFSSWTYFCGTPPVHVPLYLTHNSNNDNCEAIMVQDLCFDITELYNLCEDTSVIYFSIWSWKQLIYLFLTSSLKKL